MAPETITEIVAATGIGGVALWLMYSLMKQSLEAAVPKLEEIRKQLVENVGTARTIISDMQKENRGAVMQIIEQIRADNKTAFEALQRTSNENMLVAREAIKAMTEQSARLDTLAVMVGRIDARMGGSLEPGETVKAKG
jgi:hypothetical protein